MRILGTFFSIIMALVSMLNGLGFQDATVNNLNTYIAQDCISVADFIENNFELFVEEYNNSSDEDEDWYAEYVENRFIITVNECGNEYKGVFLDFDNDNGYAVVGDDYNLCDFKTQGESPYLDIVSDSYCYSVVCGYCYLRDGEYVSVNEENNADENFIYDNVVAKNYAGHEDKNVKGCGRIEDPDQYVNDKYDGGWTLGRNNHLNMQGYAQWYLSCYIKDGSEGNCWFVSAYHVLQYMADVYWKNMPQRYAMIGYYNPQTREPTLYAKYMSEGYRLNDSRTITELYADVRKHINERYQQVDEGMIWDTSEIIEYVARQYGHYVNSVEHIAWGLYTDTATKKIDSGYPVLWSTSNDTYGSHTMAVCGYKYYWKTTGWWIFKTASYKLFFEIKDGWVGNGASRYYDISGHAGFSAIISLEF